jgi:hypothetical protein
MNGGLFAFQIVALPIVGWFLVRSAWRLVQRQRPRWVGLAGVVLWSAAALAILRPELTNEAAHLLGIGRGADLLLYAVAMAFLAACFYFYQRTRRLEADVTRVVRHLAIREALAREPPDGAGPGGEE